MCKCFLRWFVFLTLIYCAGVLCAEPVPGSFEALQQFRKPAPEMKMAVDGFLWIEAEDFDDYGEWRLDTQFVHKMGSAYLLAGGVGKPIPDAVTQIAIPKAGTYRIWARTRNWLQGYAPGKFTVSVNGEMSKHILGDGKPEVWAWESAGEFELPSGSVSLALHDLTGAFGRCDALILTTDLSYVPPEELEACQTERARLTGAPQDIAELGDFDVVVVGAGSAGVAAAVASAKTGAITALVHDRPVLGGNASVEMGVPTLGASRHHPNARESGLNEEAGLMRAKNGAYGMSEAYHIQVSRESNLTVFNNTRVINTELNEDGGIGAVRGVNTLTLEPSRVRGKVFIDCTGDGWVGYFAGAKYRFGRESRAEFAESLAPLESDEITMSGAVLGNRAFSYRATNTGHPVEYRVPDWAMTLPPADEFNRKPDWIESGSWWIEHPGDMNDLVYPEKARDQLIRIIFAYWGFIKNDWERRDDARNFELAYVASMDGRRETRRLVGDYILKQQDVEAGRMFPDRITYGGWTLDVHHPLGILSGKEGPYYCDKHVPIYSIPYRCIYSTNVPNLFMAGRDISVTHMALGTVRVQGTLSTVGQAAGTAAAMCIMHGVNPRQLGQEHIHALQQQLLKDDQYIPELANEDPADLARTAAVSASSVQNFRQVGQDAVRLVWKNHPLNICRAMMFDRGLNEHLDQISLCMLTEGNAPAEVTLHVREADAPDDYSSMKDLAVVKATVPPGNRSFVTFEVNCSLSKPYAWVWLESAPGVRWVLSASGSPGASRAHGRPWTVVSGQQYAFYTVPELRYAETGNAPQSVIDGVSRPVDEMRHGWISDAKRPLPQWLELDFGKPVEMTSVRLTFDTDLNADRPHHPVAEQCVKDYRIEAFDGQVWKELVTKKDNYFRHQVHCFAKTTATKVRVVVEATHGDPSARIFEIRIY